ncbi:MAG: hypothetical protein QM664_03425 [Flavihumibacter sp.]
MTRYPARLTLYMFFACGLCWGFAYFSLNILHWRGWGYTVALPLVLATGSTILHGYPHDMPGKSLRNTAWLTMVVYSGGLLLFGWETLPWLLMAAPLTMLFTYTGFLLGLFYLRSKLRSELSMSLILLFISVPVVITFENIYKQAATRSVTCQVEIAVSPEKLQQQLRYDRSLLRVKPDIQAHDHEVLLTTVPGYLFADKNQLHLVAVANGKTVLSGTSYYRQCATPAIYWNTVADKTLRIYQHYCLNHIRETLEEQGGFAIK